MPATRSQPPARCPALLCRGRCHLVRMQLSSSAPSLVLTPASLPAARHLPRLQREAIEKALELRFSVLLSPAFWQQAVDRSLLA